MVVPMPNDPTPGRLNTLAAVARHPSGMFLDGGTYGEILLPNRYVPDGLEPGGEIEVFLSNDSEDRLVATTDRPLAMAGEFALLEVVATTRVGAFLDWGMPKDLLLPFGEQARPVLAGDEVLVYIQLDRVSGRLVASSKLNRFVDEIPPSNLSSCTRVALLIAERTDLGFKAIVDDRYWGLLPNSLAPTVPPIGTRCTGYISRITEEGLVDLSFELPGYGRVAEAADRLATVLAGAGNGFLAVHDKSPPELVRKVTGMSKKVFKQAAGALYRDKRIRIAEDGIYWLGTGDRRSPVVRDDDWREMSP
jgi:predicted RNA-binding protein (virulence factor B family)